MDIDPGRPISSPIPPGEPSMVPSGKRRNIDVDNPIATSWYNVETGAHNGPPNNLEYVPTLRPNCDVVRTGSGHGSHAVDGYYVLARAHMDIT